MLDLSVREILRKLAAVRRRPSRIVDFLREPRPLVVGGALANRLGLQVARTCADRVAWHSRRSRVTPTVRDAYVAMARDGVFVQHDFLPPGDFAALRAELARTRSGAERRRYTTTVFGENFVHEELLVTDWPADYPHACRLMRDDPFIRQLAAAVTRRDISYAPHVVAQYLHKPDPAAPHTDYDYNQYIHTDRHYPFVKVFFYLDDVDAETAPYTYVPRSHKISLARLRYEYDLSLRYVRARRGSRHAGRSPEQLTRDRTLYAASERLLREMQLTERPLCGKANTLIMSNNQGLHRRGEMRGRRARVTLNMDFKYLESLAHHLYPVLKYLSA